MIRCQCSPISIITVWFYDLWDWNQTLIEPGYTETQPLWQPVLPWPSSALQTPAWHRSPPPSPSFGEALRNYTMEWPRRLLNDGLLSYHWTSVRSRSSLVAPGPVGFHVAGGRLVRLEPTAKRESRQIMPILRYPGDWWWQFQSPMLGILWSTTGHRQGGVCDRLPVGYHKWWTLE